ncbi:sulfatase-like hydrolase/transferase [Synechococcus sp. GEYO]|uniref:sulfatase-like hydrolase/transferase n=1 Tax=Synechococcus sp. GEYO TaxID=2575511 RepID=UPI000E0E3E29|nr:sulfatase-like hydrolase/transferase [Synechococcus sp. GEYO]
MSQKNANLLLVTFDQWRGDWGNPQAPVVQLPNLEKISKLGWAATRCYTSSPHCVPARFSWLTGLMPSQMCVTQNQGIDLPADAPSIVRELRNNGYYTALVGKTHWTRHDKKNDLRNNKTLMNMLGFDNVIEVAGPRALRRISCELTDDWEKAGVMEQQLRDLEERYGSGLTENSWKVKPSILPTKLYPDCWITTQAKRVLKEIPMEKPWMLWVSFVGPHEPFDTPHPWHGMNEKTDLPQARRKPKWIEELSNEVELKKLCQKWHGKLTEKIVIECRKDYADHMMLLDNQLGILLNTLNSRDDATRTAIAITADHGELLGDAGMLYKGCFLEGAINVPWIYKGPDNVKKHKQTKYSNKPVELTGLLKQTFRGLTEGGGAYIYLQKWAERQRGAIIEYGKERVFIRGHKKLCVDFNGQYLWAINTKKDPNEQCNVIKEKYLRWKFSFDWYLLKRWALKESNHRSEKLWIWRELGPDH